MGKFRLKSIVVYKKIIYLSLILSFFAGLQNRLSAQITPIYDIQGSGASSPLNGTGLITEGIVTGDFQGNNQLNGFFIQDSLGDGNDSTSDGIFVYNPGGINVNLGDFVQVTGEVDEYFGLTEITNVTIVNIISQGHINTIKPTEINLPIASIFDFEKKEGMLVQFSQKLTVTENYNLGRYGELTLSANGRLINPTNIIDPNDNPASGLSCSGNSNVAAIINQQDINDRSKILLNDGSTTTNLDTIPFLNPADSTLRCGSSIDSLVGIINYSFGTYLVESTLLPKFNYESRPSVPTVGNANLKVASFNPKSSLEN